MQKTRILSIFLLLPIYSFSQENIEWITHFGSPSIYYGVELGRKIETDSEGNIYVAGEFADIIRFGDIEWTSNGNKEIFLVKLDSNGIVQWFKNFGGTEADWCGDICVDHNSNIYLSGTFRERITIGDSIFTSSGGLPGYDFFLAKINKDGQVVWSKASTGNGSNSVRSITKDDDGFLYLTGYYNHTLTFDDYEFKGPIGRSDLFVIKLDEYGEIMWANTTKSNANNFGNDIVSDNNGHLYLTGSMWDSVCFNEHLLVSTGIEQTFISKMDANTGSFLWAIRGGGNGWHEGNSIIVDTNGDIIINGWYRNDLYFNTNSVFNGGNDNGPDDIFIAKFDTSGSNIWIKTAQSNLYSNSYDMVTNSQNDIFLTGKFRGVLQIGNNNFYSTISSYFDICVIKLNEDGNFEWLKSFGGNSPMNDIGYGITLFNGNVLVTGMYSSNSMFDNSLLSCNGASDIFILKLSNTTNSTIINSVDQEENDIEILVYPNPSSNSLYIKTNEDKFVQYKIKILDINGNLIFFDNCNYSNLIEINISTLYPGIYVLQIIDLKTKTIINRKFIKNN